MADFLNTGVSALIAYQTALTTTSHNVANANTPGFSRQKADLATRTPQPTGAGFMGTGVNVTSITRTYDAFTVGQVRTNTSLSTSLDTYFGYAQQVDNILADANSGMSPVLQSFFDAVHGVANNPSSTPARQVLLSQSQTLVDRFHAINERFNALRSDVSTSIRETVNQINSLADSIAQVNQNIVVSLGQSGGLPPNDLLDQRDELVRQLSQLVPVNTVTQDNGAMNVFIGKGQTLVLGDKVSGLTTVPNVYDVSRVEVASASNGALISDYLTGGKIGGALDFRRQMLDTTQNALGRLAEGLTMAVNDQHSRGLDLNGNIGGEFFSVSGLGIPVTATPASTNKGIASGSFTLSSAPGLTNSDYRLSTADGTNYTLTRLSDNAVVGTVVAGTPFTGEGIAITVTAGGVAGDSFQIQPTRSAARDISLQLTSTSQVAAASPVRGVAALTNLGTGNLSNLLVGTAASMATVTTSTVAMTYNATAPTGYDISINGVATGVTLPFDPTTQSGGTSFDLGTVLGAGGYAGAAAYNGVGFTLSGKPFNGDVITISKNTSGTSDNGNALALASVQNKQIFDNGNVDLQSNYAKMVSDTGSKTRQLEVNSTAQKSVLNQSTQARDAISGVNLDEEAANLVKFQQAYQASAQLISTANVLFNALLAAVR